MRHRLNMRQQSYRLGLLVTSLGLLLVLPLPATARDCGDGILDPAEECDDANFFGGDGCAQNCTFETVRDFVIDPERSTAVTQFRTQKISLHLSGRLRFTTGGPDHRGEIPLVVRHDDVRFDPIQVPSLACVCVRAFELPPEFGFGPGNVAGGTLGCGPNGLFTNEFAFTQNHHLGRLNECVGGDRNGEVCGSDTECPGGRCFSTLDCAAEDGRTGNVEDEALPHPGVCNGPQLVSLGGTGSPRGTMILADSISFAMIFDGGTCCSVGSDPDCVDPNGMKGVDGIPCTDDDLDLGQATSVPATTTRGTVSVLNADDVQGASIAPGEMCGSAPCVAEVSGVPFDCDAIAANPTGGMENGVLGLGLPILHQLIGDSVSTIHLAAAAACPGDCNRDGFVRINELILAVSRALGNRDRMTCGAADRNNDGSVGISELVAAVNGALFGCLSPLPGPNDESLTFGLPRRR